MSQLSESIKPYSTVGLDTALFIYHFEKHPVYWPLTQELLSGIEQGERIGITSTITLMAIIVKPLSLGRNDIACKYETLLMNFPNIEVVDPYRDVFTQAARLRTDYRLRLLDALQLCTCLLSGAEVFVTNNRQIERIKEKLDIIFLDDLLDHH